MMCEHKNCTNTHTTQMLVWVGNQLQAWYLCRKHAATTKERINFALRGIAFVSQKNYCWHLSYEGKTYDFSSGMMIDTVTKTVQTGT